MEVKVKWKYKYKNLFFLGLSTFTAVFMVRNVFLREILISYLSEWSYLGAFLAGLLFPYALTAPISASIFILISKFVNFLIASLLGALGAFVGDYLIFKFVKHHLSKEIDEILSKGRIKFKEVMVSEKFRKIVPVIAGLIIASPLPDEIGIALLAMSEFETKKFFYLSYSLHFFGILSLILFGKII
ncbi:MAG: hypothetical protein QW451_02635 [Candidatus Aenigmatarchaeota archaeon]